MGRKSSRKNHTVEKKVSQGTDYKTGKKDDQKTEYTAEKEIGAKVDYIAEGIALLQHLGSGIKYADLRETLNRKYADPFQEGLQKFELLERIEQGAKEAFQKEMKEVQYYFQSSGEGDFSCAGVVVLLWNACMNCRFQDVSSYREYLEGISEKEYCEKYGECLQCYHVFVQDAVKVKTEEPFDVISYLMKMELPDEEKWRLQKIFFDEGEHRKKVFELLEKAVAYLESWEEELLKITEEFSAYWTQVLDGRSFADYAKEILEIDIGQSPMGFCLSPSVIRPNVISFYSYLQEDGTYQGKDDIRIGILFGKDFTIQVKTEEEDGFYEYATQVLKLLGDKSKFEILSYIRDKEAYGSELAKHLNLTTATVSHHMNALLSARLVEVKRVDTRVYYLLNKKTLQEVLDYSKRRLIGESEEL